MILLIIYFAMKNSEYMVMKLLKIAKIPVFKVEINLIFYIVDAYSWV